MTVMIRNRGKGEEPVVFQFRDLLEAVEFASTALECMTGDLEVTLVKDEIPSR